MTNDATLIVIERTPVTESLYIFFNENDIFDTLKEGMFSNSLMGL